MIYFISNVLVSAGFRLLGPERWRSGNALMNQHPTYDPGVEDTGGNSAYDPRAEAPMSELGG